MSLSPKQERLLLMQDYEEEVRHQIGKGRRTTLYLRSAEVNDSPCFFSAMVVPDRVEKSLQNHNWDISIGGGRPSFCTQGKKTWYDRLGHENGVEPIIHVRGGGLVELIEEFRLLYGLHPGLNDELVRENDMGDKETVALITADRVEVDTLLLRQFLAVKGMYLLVFFHHTRSFRISISEVEKKDYQREFRDHEGIFGFWLTDMHTFSSDDDSKTVASCMGKKIIKPVPIEKCGIWPYTERRSKSYADYIIGVSEEGDAILHTSDPDKLANFFGKNPTAAPYLTPVCFKREALLKYYQNPQKYSVEDGLVRCGCRWSVRIDNHHDDVVFVYLGDLGRDIPHAEQLYWKSFNILPTGPSSETNYRRSILGEFANTANFDFVLKRKLSNLEEVWEKKFGWPLFRSFTSEDAHALNSLHSPLVSDQAPFDQQILNLAKTMIDRLNVEAIIANCKEKPQNSGSINALEQFLRENKMPAGSGKLSILRDVQNLRSTGAAHLKGSNYERLVAKLDIRSNNLIKAFREILSRSISLIEDLEEFINSK